MKLDVPYYSQFSDVEDEYWAPRVCGFCCFKMVAKYHGVDTGDIVEMGNRAKSEDGYGEHGIIHDYVLRLAKEFGLSAYRQEKMDEKSGVNKILSFLDAGNPVIVSVAGEREGNKLFHQIVVVDYEKENENIKGFYIHDSGKFYNEGGPNIFLSYNDFLKEWRRMAIFIEK
jgi:ABC-type bacteriocin/lantibiotic exporter with double-glycine peptidase domain